uniref:Chitinase domain-containing protein 1 n=1 Tax=Ixodes ricinus TaxID=34613 RepID=A0A147BF42_IXORI
MKFNSAYSLVLLCLLPVNTRSTISPSDKKKVKSVKPLPPGETTVFERELVTEHVKVHDILKHHQSYCRSKTADKRFRGPVLGYVTPWNNRGYDIAKIFGAKFAYVSPVWLQLEVSQAKGGFSVAGQHDVDQGWIEDVRSPGRNVKMVPRILFERWTPNQLVTVSSSKKKLNSMATILQELADKSGFDGYVVELWSQFGGQMAEQMTKLIQHLAQRLQEKNLDIILVIPPSVYQGNAAGMFTKKDFDNLSKHVTAFSLMTYDYSSPQRPGPSSPIGWVRKCVESLAPPERCGTGAHTAWAEFLRLLLHKRRGRTYPRKPARERTWSEQAVQGELGPRCFGALLRIQGRRWTPHRVLSDAAFCRSAAETSRGAGHGCGHLGAWSGARLLLRPPLRKGHRGLPFFFFFRPSFILRRVGHLQLAFIQ